MSDRTASAGPLTGVRIVDLTWAGAGPQATLLLAMLGAEIIKVESTTRLDLFRRDIEDPSRHYDETSRFNAINLNKRSIEVDLKAESGPEMIAQLCRDSDALIENFRPGVLERLGLDYETLSPTCPHLVVVSLSTAGRGGPQSQDPGYAAIFNAIGGLGHMTGYADGPPTEVRDSVDLRVGTITAFSLLAALYYQRRTGRGQYVDVSAREAVTSLIGDSLIEYALGDEVPARRGNQTGLWAPYDVYRCAGDDRWVAIAVRSDREWLALCGAMSRPELADDPRFGDAILRHRHRQELDALVTAWTMERSAEECAAACIQAGVPASPVLAIDELPDHPHLLSRDVFTTVEHPRLGQLRTMRGPWRFRSGLPELAPAPMLGADTAAVLGSLSHVNSVAGLASSGGEPIARGE
jgi:crotonobetainyl-CoA:carnitine CoA-transferase CaiB-like acyl-CoA transferase